MVEGENTHTLMFLFSFNVKTRSGGPGVSSAFWSARAQEISSQHPCATAHSGLQGSHASFVVSKHLSSHADTHIKAIFLKAEQRLILRIR